MKFIPLGRGFFAKVDDADFERVNQFKWHSRGYKNKGTKIRYAVRSVWNGKTFDKIYLHHFIFGDKLKRDHRNGDGLDNQRENLRLCNNSDNSRNRSMARNNTSGLKGVSWHNHTGKWRASLSINDRHVSLGVYDDKIHAAKVYDGISVLIFGEFAKTNRQLGLIQ